MSSTQHADASDVGERGEPGAAADAARAGGARGAAEAGGAELACGAEDTDALEDGCADGAESEREGTCGAELARGVEDTDAPGDAGADGPESEREAELAALEAAQKASLKRRTFVGLAAVAVLAAAAGSYACSIGAFEREGSQADDDTESDPGDGTGLATDTSQRDYAVELALYADSYVRWHETADGTPLLDYLLAAYQQDVKSDVTFSVSYLDPPDMLACAQEGFPDGDAVIALSATVERGNEAGTLDGGEGSYMVRSLAYHLQEKAVVVRLVGTQHTLPDADTLDGEDSDDGTYNRLQKLADYDGLVAIADAQTTTEGLCANITLANQGLYSSEDGVSGEYESSIADKVRVYGTQDEVMAALETGECQLAFALKTGLATRYPDAEVAYTPPKGMNVHYDGCAIMGAKEGPVARDVFEFLANYFTG